MKAIVFGAGGFIGHHLVNRLKKEGYRVTGVDLKHPPFSPSEADEFILADLRQEKNVKEILSTGADELYQLAADMGGAGYIFTGENDANVMHNSALINLNTVYHCIKFNIKKVFFSSSACVYPAYNQADPDNPVCSEDSAYPAQPDSEYGWEKLFSERLYLSFQRNYGLNVRIARFHNIFGPECEWQGGREKAPAALCRKVALARNGEEIEVWGSGAQTRSFLYIDECIEGVRRMMLSNFTGPLNIGSEEMVTINQLAQMIIQISGKNLRIVNMPGPVGVMGRKSDNRLISEVLGWKPSQSLLQGVELTYRWVEGQVAYSQHNSTKRI
ncbi:MAG: NAD-dependent epimerase/dehydratase family protein [Chitinophagales bacterium]|nr:NAD-dependent epimerase/dehydratase family protein [Chitinophagales bacterium]MDW8418233.1 NAD-dependent epimerase/dehydratase family protein [Chitinophagales bacterium]